MENIYKTVTRKII